VGLGVIVKLLVHFLGLFLFCSLPGRRVADRAFPSLSESITFPRSNRQRFCLNCGRENEKKYSRIRAKRFYWKNASEGLRSVGLGAKKRNEINIF